MYLLGRRPNPIGFIAVGSMSNPGLFVRFLRWHVSIKPTKHELFSQRYGYTKTYRLAGLSFSVKRLPEPSHD